MKSTGEVAKSGLDRHSLRGLFQNTGTLAVARVTGPTIERWISTSSWCSEAAGS